VLFRSRGYRLEGETYHPINDRYSQVLSLRLQPEGALLGLYRSDTGEKLPQPSEVADALKIAETNLEQERQRAERLAEQLRQLGVDPNHF
jgi:hypothetical protein